MPFVVTIKKGDEIGTRLRDASVTRHRYAAILLCDDAKASILKLARYCATAVCRTIVDDENFKVPHGLRMNRVQAPQDIRLLVIQRHYYGDRRPSHNVS